jgi:hypothetical protein
MAALGPISRRDFMIGAGALAAVGSLSRTRRAHSAQSPGGTPAAPKPATELVVQPVLTYEIPQRRAQTSWRSWGGIQTPAQATEEGGRIEKELRALAASSGLPLKLLPVALVNTPEQAAQIKGAACDVTLIYAAGGWRNLLDPLVAADRPAIFFLRHDPGPVYLWYEIMHPHFLRNATDKYTATGIDVQDVVVDEYAELAWRLRALLALRRTLGQRILAIGGASGWGEGQQLAPQWAREKWHLDIVDIPYPDLAKRIESLRREGGAIAEAARAAETYLSQPNTKLQTDQKFVENAFLLTRVFQDLLREHDARALTVNSCMGTIMPISETTACLPLSLLNDEGYLAFCESDFVVIPSGILMHHITGTPVFLNDPTWPHNGIVTIAHCTAPRKMDGKTPEPATIHTHFESDYGAAPKVELRIGQVVTNVVPDFACQKWVGFKGKVVANPFLDICRSQTDITIDGDWQRLLEDMRGFHWMTVYGDCRREVGYALKRLGIAWQDISA